MCMLNNFVSEEDFLKFLDKYIPNKDKGLILGRGDDCAIICPPKNLLISSDLFLEDIHFDLSYFTPYYLGYKSLAVNISDIAAMGGEPIGFNMSLMINKSKAKRDFFREFFLGIKELMDKYNLYLAGGDLSFSKIFGVDITIWGDAKHKTFFRKRARAGDLIFITGDIGLSRCGLFALKMGLNKDFNVSVMAHLKPDIHVEEARIISKNPYVTSLMDVSDGLFKDIYRLIPENFGAKIELSIDDIHKEVLDIAKILKEDPIYFAGKGGEDYVLLGTCDIKGISYLKENIPNIKIIGEVIDRPEFLINGAPLKGGFDHFQECL